MQIAHFGLGLRDDFAVEFEDDAQHAVRGGVRRSHVQDHLFALHVLQILLARTRQSFRCNFGLAGGVVNLDFLNFRHLNYLASKELENAKERGLSASNARGTNRTTHPMSAPNKRSAKWTEVRCSHPLKFLCSGAVMKSVLRRPHARLSGNRVFAAGDRHKRPPSSGAGLEKATSGSSL